MILDNVLNSSEYLLKIFKINTRFLVLRCSHYWVPNHSSWVSKSWSKGLNSGPLSYIQESRALSIKMTFLYISWRADPEGDPDTAMNHFDVLTWLHFLGVWMILEDLGLACILSYCEWDHSCCCGRSLFFLGPCDFYFIIRG